MDAAGTQVIFSGGQSSEAIASGFPLDTPLSEMTDAEQAAYWRNESKKQQRRFSAALAQLRQTVDDLAHI